MITLMSVLLAAILGAAMSSATVPGTWLMTVFVESPEMIVSPDGTYCRMPATVPVLPNSIVRLSSQDHEVIASAQLKDAVEEVGADPYTPCALGAVLPDIPILNGYLLEIVPESSPPELPASATIQVAWSIGSLWDESFEVTYDEFGYKVCDFPEASPIRIGTEIRTRPLASPSPPMTESTEFGPFPISPTASGDACSLVAFLVFPIAEKYELAVGSAELTVD